MNIREVRLKMVNQLLGSNPNQPVSKIINSAKKLSEFIVNGDYEDRNHHPSPLEGNLDKRQECNAEDQNSVAQTPHN